MLPIFDLLLFGTAFLSCGLLIVFDLVPIIYTIFVACHDLIQSPSLFHMLSDSLLARNFINRLVIIVDTSALKKSSLSFDLNLLETSTELILEQQCQWEKLSQENQEKEEKAPIQ